MGIAPQNVGGRGTWFVGQLDVTREAALSDWRLLDTRMGLYLRHAGQSQGERRLFKSVLQYSELGMWFQKLSIWL